MFKIRKLYYFNLKQKYKMLFNKVAQPTKKCRLYAEL